MKIDFSVSCSPLKTVVSRKVILLFHILAVDFIFGMGFVSFFNKKLGLFCYSPKERKHHQWNVPLVFMLDWVCFSLCLVHICKGHCLCPMQLPGFEDNCFNWTQISFLSLRMRPSISWVGPGYNYTESSSSHQCVHVHTFLSLDLQQLFFYLPQLFLFAGTTFYLQQLYFFCSNFFICSMYPVGHLIKQR